jgi:LmbE family N-acetylglucosaminyl deacetylase
VKNWLRGVLSSGRPPATGPWSPGPAMTIVAHPDDDLYFINPGIRVAMSAKAQVVGVVVTSGQGDGINVDVDDPERVKAPVDHAGYSTARRVGLRRAYAKMAGLPVDSPWRRELVKLAGGWTVERATLRDAPHVILYFCGIGHVPVDGRNRSALLPLVDDELDAAPTLAATDLPHPVGRITKETLIAGLVELLEKHRPTVVRTMDPDPEPDWGRAEYTVSDHTDHTATARLAFLAVQRLAGRDPAAAPAMEYFRAYANRFWPRNCSPRLHQEKRSYLLTYGGADGEPHPGYDHGDYQIGPEPYRSTHIYSTAQRYTATASWLAPLPSGALAAFAVRGDRLLMWREREAGTGRWQGPFPAEVDGLLPTLAVARAGDGVRIVALRRSEEGKGVIEVGIGCLTAGENGLSGWTALDGPDAADPDDRRPRLTGVPAATVDGDGRLWVFARNAAGRLSVRRETAGGWQPWERLEGGPTPLQDVLVATTTEAGLVEVYVAAKRTVACWRQAVPGGPLVVNNGLKSTPVASGGLTVARTGGDRTCLYFRQAETGMILCYREHADPGRWPGAPADLGGYDGLGPIAAIGRPTGGAGDMVMAQRNRYWTASVAVPPAGKGSRWQRLPGMITGAPALAPDAEGRGVLAVAGLDGRLHVCRQEADEPTSAFGDWQTV